jgi:hypothetical protein
MKRILALAVLLAATSAVLYAQRQSQKHLVRKFFMEGIAAFKAHDLESFMKQFADDVEMYTPTGWLRGRQSVRARFA